MKHEPVGDDDGEITAARLGRPVLGRNDDAVISQ
jgi:hypothetical protein